MQPHAGGALVGKGSECKESSAALFQTKLGKQEIAALTALINEVKSYAEIPVFGPEWRLRFRRIILDCSMMIDMLLQRSQLDKQNQFAILQLWPVVSLHKHGVHHIRNYVARVIDPLRGSRSFSFKPVRFESLRFLFQQILHLNDCHSAQVKHKYELIFELDLRDYDSISQRATICKELLLLQWQIRRIADRILQASDFWTFSDYEREFELGEALLADVSSAIISPLDAAVNIYLDMLILTTKSNHSIASKLSHLLPKQDIALKLFTDDNQKASPTMHIPHPLGEQDVIQLASQFSSCPDAQNTTKAKPLINNKAYDKLVDDAAQKDAVERELTCYLASLYKD